MKVTVLFTGPIKSTTGVREMEMEAGTVKELIDSLNMKFGEKFKEEVKKTKILVNGYPVQFYEGLCKRLKDGDIVDFLQNWRIPNKESGVSNSESE